MSIISIIAICLSFFVLGIQTAAYAFVPDRFPFDPYLFFGWVLYIVVVILFDVSGK